MRDYLFSNAATFAASAAAFSAASAAAFSAASSVTSAVILSNKSPRATGTGKMDFFLSLWLLFCLYFTSSRPVPGEYFPDCIFFKIVSAPDVSKSLIHFVNDAGEEVYLPCIFPGRFEMASFDISVSASICKYGLGR